MKQHKKTLILTSLLTLLPILVGLVLWNRFPEHMAIHWGFTGQPDGWSSVPFAVFALYALITFSGQEKPKHTSITVSKMDPIIILLCVICIL